MPRVGSSIPIPKEVIWTCSIVVWPFGRSRNGKRNLHNSRLKDSLRADDGYALLIKFKPFSQDCTRNDLAIH